MSTHRRYRLVGRDVSAEVLTRLRRLDGWPANPRYAACCVGGDGAFRAYVELNKPARPSALASLSGVTVEACPAGLTREHFRAEVLDMPGATASWQVGDWEAGRSGVHKTTTTLQDLQAVVAQQQLTISALQAQVAAAAVSGSGAGPSSVVNNNNTTINHNHNHTTHNNNNTTINNTHVTVVLRDFRDENTSYISEATRLARLRVKGNGLMETMRDLHFNAEHPENHNVGVRSARSQLCEVFVGGEWQVRPCGAVAEEMMLRALAVNHDGITVVFPDTHADRYEDFISWHKDIHALRNGTSRKPHVLKTRSEAVAMILSRRCAHPGQEDGPEGRQ